MYTVSELIQSLQGLPSNAPVHLCFKGLFATVDLVAWDPETGHVELYNEVDRYIAEGLDQ